MQVAFLRCRKSMENIILFEPKTEIVQPYKVEPNEEDTSTSENILHQFWVFYIKDEIDVTNSIHT